MSRTKYKRVLLKISGEQLAGNKTYGIDPEFVAWLAEEIKKVVDSGVQIAVVVGGGNWLRGASFAGSGLNRATADYMGMLATLMNGMALMDMLESHGCEVRLQTNIQAQAVAEPFIRRRALRHMQKGRVVIIAGGTGKPYVTTDSAAVNVALELECQAVLKGTKVDGVYDKDPHKFEGAKRYSRLTHQQAIESEQVKVMDKAALGLAMEQKIPIVVFNFDTKDNFLKVVKGQSVGTTVD